MTAHNVTHFQTAVKIVDLPIVRPPRPLKIVVTEDNGMLRRLLTLALSRDGHEVVETRNASELLDLMASRLIQEGRNPFDLVICEQMLPGISGFAVLAGLRRRDRSTPFILITSDREVQKSARRLGGVVLDRSLTLDAIRRAICESAAQMPPVND
jgi:CheY-like chemotaxis protein